MNRALVDQRRTNCFVLDGSMNADLGSYLKSMHRNPHPDTFAPRSMIRDDGKDEIP